MCYAVGMVASVMDAHGDVLSPAANVNFNDARLWGKVPEYGLGNTGGTGSDTTYWFFTGVGNNSSLIDTYAHFPEVPAPYAAFDGVKNPRPSYMTEPSLNTGLAKVNVGAGVLERTFVPVPTPEGLQRDSFVDVPEGGLYVDMLVKYDTGFVGLPAAELYANDGVKVGFGMLADEASGKNFFFVAAGCWRNGAFGVTNYVTGVELSTSRWYRVSARMFANAATKSGETYPAFAVYLDGEEVRCADAASYETPMGAAAASLFAGNEHFAARALFPSMQRPGGDHFADKAYSVAFQGLGYVDEIGVASNVFAVATNEIDLVVVCDDAALEKLDYTATAGGEVYASGSVTSGFDGLTIPARPGATVRLVPTSKPTTALGEALTLGGNLSAVASNAAYTVCFRSGATFADDARVTASIASKSAYFSAGDRRFTRFSDALAAIEPGATVKVVQNVTLDGAPRAENGQAWVKPGQSLVLDLNGKRVKGEHFDEEAAIYNQGQLQIVDSVGGGSIEAPGLVIANDWTDVSTNAALDVNHAVALLTVGDKDSKLFKVRGRVTCTRGKLVIRTGEFLTPADEPNPSTRFYLSDYVDPSGRFFVNPAPAHATEGWYWTVCWNNEFIVRFQTAHGTVTPESVLADASTPVAAPVLDAPGYDFGGWYEGETPVALPTTFADDATLVAALTPQAYTVTNDWFANDFPTNYTVETPSKALRVPARPNFAFGGWRDKATGNFVTNIGAGACFVGTTTVVTGNLDLAATWLSLPIRWENVSRGSVESNGTYSGKWTFTLPATAELPAGSLVKVSEISFCVVNPLQYGRTSPRLAIRTVGGAARYVSAPRALLEEDPVTHEYVNVPRMANGRPKVTYDFGAENALVEVGAVNEVYFCSDAAGTPGSGFLRLIRASGSTESVIGNCEGADPASPDPRYGDYRPAYEVVGEVQP